MHLSPTSASNWVRNERRKLARLSAEIIGSHRPAGSPGPPDGTRPGSTPASQAIDSAAQPEAERKSAFTIPHQLLVGMEMTKVGSIREKRRVYRLEPDEGKIVFVKSGKDAAIAIETIKEIRSGADAHYYRALFKYPEDAESRWITVVYVLDSKYKTLHLIADTQEMSKMWDASLRKLFAIRQGLISGFDDVGTREAIWERQYWKSADKGGDQKLDFGEVKWLCRRLNTNLEGQNARAVFDEVDSRKKGYLTFSEFQKFVKKLKRRPEIEDLYKIICDQNSGKFDFNAFASFMQKYQGSTLDNQSLHNVFERYASRPKSTAEPASCDLEAFSAFLISSDNTGFPLRERKVWQDMTKPIAEYYVSSSHNTYLIGHQLMGVSTIEGYIRALLHGCRSVELDIYDGKEEPLVFHGKTFTSAVSVRDICTAIARYGFTTSPYPIIISAEIHCGIPQQDTLVEIMVEVFGDKLVRAPVEGRPKIDQLPSPESLKGMVLLKAKNLYVVAQLDALRMQKAVERQAVLDATSSSSSEEDVEDYLMGKLKEKWRSVRGKATASSLEEKRSSMNTTLMSLSLASLLVYTIGIRCHGFDGTVVYCPEYMFSLSESQANRMIAKPGSKKTEGEPDQSDDGMRNIIRHTRTCLVRIYPKGLRFDSSNYEPNRFWAAGAQVVAVNWQTFDIGYMMTQAMFLRNGRAGYVLKPLALRQPEEELLKKRTNHVLELTVVSAQQLPRLKNGNGQEIVEKGVVDPFVKVTLRIPDWNHSPLLTGSNSLPTGGGIVNQQGSTLPTSGASAKNAPTAVRSVSGQTRVIKNNGFNPIWRETLALPFDCVGGQEMQDLIFVEFKVLQEGKDGEGDKPIASYFTPLSCLQPGYRHLPLHDSQHMPYLFSTLFVESTIRDLS